jgi:hypothetical protein
MTATLVTATLNAATSFTSSSTGRDWLAASFTDRVEWCNMQAKRLQKIAPGITGDYLFQGLVAYYGSPDKPNQPNLPSKLVEVVAFITTYYVKDKETPQ